MVISQIAGLATAFGTGELSGAGFGPNYTILMKLGYEFFAPRILQEMEKNPNVFFQDTLWFQKFQKQIKLYSDAVMKQTLETLLTIPDETLEAIKHKYLGSGTVEEGTNLAEAISPVFAQAQTVQAISKSTDFQPFIQAISGFFNALASVIPSSQFAGAEHIQTTTGLVGTSGLPPDTGSSIRTVSTATGLTVSRSTLARWSFTHLNNAMSAITKGNSPYSETTQQEIRRLWNNSRSNFDKEAVARRQAEIQRFNAVKIPTSNIPARSTKRPAGQSVKMERDLLIRKIKSQARALVVREQTMSAGHTKVRILQTQTTNLKKLQQQLVFLLNNYTFS